MPTENEYLDRMFGETAASLTRGLVPLQPGEEYVESLYEPPPPDGHRYETDAEFRERIKASLAST